MVGVVLPIVNGSDSWQFVVVAFDHNSVKGWEIESSQTDVGRSTSFVFATLKRLFT